MQDFDPSRLIDLMQEAVPDLDREATAEEAQRRLWQWSVEDNQAQAVLGAGGSAAGHGSAKGQRPARRAERARLAAADRRDDDQQRRASSHAERAVRERERARRMRTPVPCAGVAREGRCSERLGCQWALSEGRCETAAGSPGAAWDFLASRDRTQRTHWFYDPSTLQDLARLPLRAWCLELADPRLRTPLALVWEAADGHRASFGDTVAAFYVTASFAFAASGDDGLTATQAVAAQDLLVLLVAMRSPLAWWIDLTDTFVAGLVGGVSPAARGPAPGALPFATKAILTTLALTLLFGSAAATATAAGAGSAAAAAAVAAANVTSAVGLATRTSIASPELMSLLQHSLLQVVNGTGLWLTTTGSAAAVEYVGPTLVSFADGVQTYWKLARAVVQRSPDSGAAQIVASTIDARLKQLKQLMVNHGIDAAAVVTTEQTAVLLDYAQVAGVLQHVANGGLGDHRGGQKLAYLAARNALQRMAQADPIALAASFLMESEGGATVDLQRAIHELWLKLKLQVMRVARHLHRSQDDIHIRSAGARFATEGPSVPALEAPQFVQDPSEWRRARATALHAFLLARDAGTALLEALRFGEPSDAVAFISNMLFDATSQIAPVHRLAGLTPTSSALSGLNVAPTSRTATGWGTIASAWSFVTSLGAAPPTTAAAAASTWAAAPLVGRTNLEIRVPLPPTDITELGEIVQSVARAVVRQASLAERRVLVFLVGMVMTTLEYRALSLLKTIEYIAGGGVPIQTTMRQAAAYLQLPVGGQQDHHFLPEAQTVAMASHLLEAGPLQNRVLKALHDMNQSEWSRTSVAVYAGIMLLMFAVTTAVGSVFRELVSRLVGVLRAAPGAALQAASRALGPGPALPLGPAPALAPDPVPVSPPALPTQSTPILDQQGLPANLPSEPAITGSNHPPPLASPAAAAAAAVPAASSTAASGTDRPVLRDRRSMGKSKQSSASFECPSNRTKNHHLDRAPVFPDKQCHGVTGKGSQCAKKGTMVGGDEEALRLCKAHHSQYQKGTLCYLRATKH